MTWQTPTPGQATLVGHVNQLLVTHAAQFAYNGAVIGSDPTLIGSATALNDAMLAQSFTVTNPVTLGTILMSLGAIGAGQDVLVTLQADGAGAPSGTPLIGCVIPAEWLPSGIATTSSVYTVPMNYALAAGTYHVVIQPGSALLPSGFSQALANVNDVQWTQTTGTGGQIYSGGTWTSESYGFGVFLRDNTGTSLLAIADDAVPNVAYPLPAKVAAYNYTSGLLSNAFEWVARNFGATMNALCRDDASFEHGIGSAVAVTNVTVAQSSAESLDGTHSLSMTATALGTMTAKVGPYPVVAGQTYSWTTAFLGPNQTAFVAAAWYDGATLIETTDGSNVVTSPTQWLPSTGTLIAPATATEVYLQFVVNNAPANSVFYVDEVGLFAGSSATWSYPGVGVASVRSLHYTNDVLENIQ